MKILLLIFIISTSGISGEENENSESINNLYSHVQYLTSTPEYRYHLNIGLLNLTANYIDSVFSIYSNRVKYQPYLVGNVEYKNIICSFGPEDGERIIVGAHYDVCYDQPGADDNASGVAGLLEIARLLSNNTENLEYRIDLVAYTLEEPPNFRTKNMGSYIHAKILFEENVQIKLMICLDMIGYFDERPNSQHYPIRVLKLFYPDEANFIAIVSNFKNHFVGAKVKRLMKRKSKINVYHISGPSLLEGIDFSDHLNFWDFGFKAVLITDTAFYRNDRYHKKSDTIDTLDFEKMSEVVNGLFWTVTKL